VLRYLVNTSGQTVPLGAGQVIVANSNFTTVTSQNLSNASSGVEAGFCTNVNITNNKCTNGTFGIRLYEVVTSVVYYNMLCGNRLDGARFLNVDSTRFIVNNVSGNQEYGLRLQSSLQNNVTKNQFTGNTQSGVYLATATVGNSIWNNSFMFNSGSVGTYDASHIQAFDQTGLNHWNSSGTPNGYGNYWYDWTTPDAVAPMGIVDLPYNISGAAGSKDYFPLTTSPEPVVPIPELPGIVVAPVLAIIICALVWTRRKQ